MIAHVVLFWGPSVRDSLKVAYRKELPDPHYQVSYDSILCKTALQLDTKAMRKYKENPWWWYAILLCLAFIAGKTV
jgi:hypothetical protein